MIEYNAINLSVLENISNSVETLLDVGCGTGNLGIALKNENRDRFVCGITYSDKEAEIAERFLDQVWVADLNATERIKLNKTFDCIVFSHVLEHTFYPGEVLRYFIKYLNKDGKVIIALPNILHFRQRVKFMNGNFKYSEEGGLMDITHFRFFDWKSAQKLITDSGLQIISKKATGNFPLGFLRRIFPKVCVKIDEFSVKKWPGLFGFQFVIVANKLAN